MIHSIQSVIEYPLRVRMQAILYLYIRLVVIIFISNNRNIVNPSLSVIIPISNRGSQETGIQMENKRRLIAYFYKV